MGSKKRTTSIRTLLSYGRKKNGCLIMGVNRSQREAAQLPQTTVKIQKQWTCFHRALWTISNLYTRHTEHIYIYIYIYIYKMCSGYKYCDPNVYFTEMRRTQITVVF